MPTCLNDLANEDLSDATHDGHHVDIDLVRAHNCLLQLQGQLKTQNESMCDGQASRHKSQ